MVHLEIPYISSAKLDVMAASSETAELKLVSSIRYKFAAVSGDEKKLSDALQSYLVSLLEKAGSQHQAVRQEVSVDHPGPTPTLPLI